MDSSWDGPWGCPTCGKTNGRRAAFCDRCGDAWAHGTPHVRKAKQQPDSGGWTYNRWSDWQKSSAYRRDASSSASHSSSRQPAAKPKAANRRRKKNPVPRNADQGKGQGNAGRGRAQGPPPAPLSWPTLDGSTHLAAATTTVPQSVAPSAQLQEENRELARLLKNAYPDAATRPEDSSAAIDKAEQHQSKSVTKSLHSATKALDRAQKLLTETIEARRVHRNIG